MTAKEKRIEKLIVERKLYSGSGNVIFGLNPLSENDVSVIADKITNIADRAKQILNEILKDRCMKVNIWPDTFKIHENGHSGPAALEFLRNRHKVNREVYSYFMGPISIYVPEIME